jgi:predicted DNA-binding transcriptional regulator AlpA
MAETPVSWLLPEEVDVRFPVSRTTRWREEKKGRFPRRVQISSKRVAYRAAEIIEWEKDPTDWARRHQTASIANGSASIADGSVPARARQAKSVKRASRGAAPVIGGGV